MMKCEDCQMIDPPDTHTCQEYEDRIKKEMTFERFFEYLRDAEQRILVLERGMLELTRQHQLNKPWSNL